MATSNKIILIEFVYYKIPMFKSYKRPVFII